MKFFKINLFLILLTVSVFIFNSVFEAKNILAQGTCSCETATSCIVTSGNNHCESGYTPHCPDDYCPYIGACSCVLLPTPGPVYSCNWSSTGWGECRLSNDSACQAIGCHGDCDLFGQYSCSGTHPCICTTPTPFYSCYWRTSGWGECRLSNDSACQAAGCYGDCSRYGSDNCQDTHPCICSTPTPALPTGYQDCQEQCVNPTYPVGNCLDTQGIDPPGCVNPPGNDDYNCEANHLDCLCCTELLEGVTPRDELNPLCGSDSINTAIGCLPIGNKNTFLAFLLRWAIGISGGVSFVLIIYSGFMIMTAGGDKRKLQSGKELLTAALSGLILIVFSVFILDLIGIRILKIPGL